MACLDYFKYMRIPLTLFPIWIQEQYNMVKLVYNGYVHLEMRHAVWDCRKLVSLQTSASGKTRTTWLSQACQYTRVMVPRIKAQFFYTLGLNTKQKTRLTI